MVEEPNKRAIAGPGMEMSQALKMAVVLCVYVNEVIVVIYDGPRTIFLKICHDVDQLRVVASVRFVKCHVVPNCSSTGRCDF